MNRALKYFAAFSLLLNLVFAGIIVAQAGRYVMGSQEAIAALPEAKQKLLHDAFQGVTHDMAAQRAKLSEARTRLVRLLTADPFDAKAYIAESQVTYELRGPIAERMAEAVANVAAQYTPQERAVLGEMFQHHWNASLLENVAGKDEKEKQ